MVCWLSVCWIDLLAFKEQETQEQPENWQPSLIPFLQSKPAYSATAEHPVGGLFRVEVSLPQEYKRKAEVIVCSGCTNNIKNYDDEKN